MLPLTELRLDSWAYKQQPTLSRPAFSHVNNEGVKALVDAICARMLNTRRAWLGLRGGGWLGALVWGLDLVSRGLEMGLGLGLDCRSVLIHILNPTSPLSPPLTLPSPTPPPLPSHPKPPTPALPNPRHPPKPQSPTPPPNPDPPEVTPLKLSLAGATTINHEAVSALLRLPVLTELDIAGCTKITPMDKMRLVAKVKAGREFLRCRR